MSNISLLFISVSPRHISIESHMISYSCYILSLLGASPFVVTFSCNHIYFVHHIPTATVDRVVSKIVQTCSGNHPVDTAVPSRGVKRSKRDVNSPPSRADVKNERSSTSTVSIYLCYVYGKNSTFHFLHLPTCRENSSLPLFTELQ